jgi:hypothetical protein
MSSRESASSRRFVNASATMENRRKSYQASACLALVGVMSSLSFVCSAGCRGGEEGAHERDGGNPRDGAIDREPEIDSGTPPGPAKALARGIAIDDVTINQAVSSTLVRDGAWVEPSAREVPVITQRDALVQVTWRLAEDFALRAIEARLELVQEDGTSLVRASTRTPSSAPDRSTMEGVFSFVIEGSAIRDATKLRVGFYETDETAVPGSDIGARFPASGSTQSLAPWTGVMPLRIMIVPTKTSCAAAPVLGGAQRAVIESYIYNLFPTNALEVRYHAAIAVPSCGEGDIMSDLVALRTSEGLGPEWYYQAHFSNDSETSSGGFAWVFEEDDASDDRVSWVQYWAGEEPVNVTHELGHNHGSNHTFSSNASPPYVPQAGAAYGGRNGYSFALRGVHHPWVEAEPIRHRILAPTIDASGARLDHGDDATFHDAMSYDEPFWVSAFTYAEWARRIRASAGWGSAGEGGPTIEVIEAFVNGRGETSWLRTYARAPHESLGVLVLEGVERSVVVDVTRGGEGNGARITFALSSLPSPSVERHAFTIAAEGIRITHAPMDSIRSTAD